MQVLVMTHKKLLDVDDKVNYFVLRDHTIAIFVQEARTALPQILCINTEQQ